MQEAEIWLALQGGLPLWSRQAVQHRGVAGRRPRNRGSASAGTPGECQGVWNEISREKDILAAQTDTLIDLCVHSVINKLRVYSHLEFWGALLVFFFFFFFCIVSLPCQSPGWAAALKNGFQAAEMESDTENEQTNANVYLVLMCFKTIWLSHAHNCNNYN